MSLKKQVVGGAFWSLIGQVGFMFIGLITNIILARLLTPFEFGQMSILMFFILIASVFTEGGLGGALVRKKEVSNDDYSTVFVFNLSVSIFFFVLIYFLSGPISDYYNDQKLQNLLIASGSILLIGAIGVTQRTRLVRNLAFKKLALIQLTAITVSSFISIYLAYAGIGVWALLLFQIITPFITTLLQIKVGGSFYSIKFKKSSFKDLYAFGVNTSLSSIISIAFDNIYSLIFGKYFSINQAGLFYQAKRLQDVPVKVFSNMAHGVVFSSLVKLQDDKRRFRTVYNQISLRMTIVMGVIFSFIFLYAESIILLLYGEEWMEAAFLMKLLSIGSFFYFQELLNLVIFKVFNQTRRSLYLEIIKKVIQSFSIVLGIYYLSILYLIYGFVVTSIISYLLNYYFSRRILGDLEWFEILIILKVLFSCVFSILICKYLIFIFELSYRSSLFLTPIFIGLLLSLFKIAKVINFRDEVRAIVTLVKS